MVERTHKQMPYNYVSPQDGNQNFSPDFCDDGKSLHLHPHRTHWTMAYILYFIKLFTMLLVACFLFLSTTINILSGKSGHSVGTLGRPTCSTYGYIWIFFLVATHICLFISLVHILFPICNENHFSSISWISNLVQTQRRRGKMKKKE